MLKRPARSSFSAAESPVKKPKQSTNHRNGFKHFFSAITTKLTGKKHGKQRSSGHRELQQSSLHLTPAKSLKSPSRKALALAEHLTQLKSPTSAVGKENSGFRFDSPRKSNSAIKNVQSKQEYWIQNGASNGRQNVSTKVKLSKIPKPAPRSTTSSKTSTSVFLKANETAQIQVTREDEKAHMLQMEYETVCAIAKCSGQKPLSFRAWLAQQPSKPDSPPQSISTSTTNNTLTKLHSKSRSIPVLAPIGKRQHQMTIQQDINRRLEELSLAESPKKTKVATPRELQKVYFESVAPKRQSVLASALLDRSLSSSVQGSNFSESLQVNGDASLDDYKAGILKNRKLEDEQDYELIGSKDPKREMKSLAGSIKTWDIIQEPLLQARDQLRARYDAESRHVEEILNPPPKKRRLPTRLTPEDQKRLNQLMEGPLSESIAETSGAGVTRKDIRKHLGLDWLNDETLTYYGVLITQRSKTVAAKEPKSMIRDGVKYKRVHAFNSFFFSKLEKPAPSGGYATLSRWTRKIDLFALDIVLVPINENGNHWTCAAINFAKKRFEYYDSLGSPKKRVYRLLREYIQEESKDKRKVDFDFEGWEDYWDDNIPTQNNSSDCGVFTCQFMESLSRHDGPFDFTQKHMRYFRDKMVLEMVDNQLMLEPFK